MKDFIEYIESSCSGIADTPTLYRYKKKILDEITERANEITHSGLKDEAVLCDLIKDEYPDLQEGYKKFAEEERLKKRASLMRKLIAVGSVAFLAIIFFMYFAISFTTRRWDITWLIIVGGIFALVIYLLSFGIKRLCKMRRVFHPIARILIAISIMMATVFVFLFCLMLVPMPNPWTIIPCGIIAMFVSDAVFAAVTRQKLAIINYLLYIPASAAMLYVVLGAQSVVPWTPGWLIVILGVLVDLAVMAGVIINNSRYVYKQEDDEWNED